VPVLLPNNAAVDVALVVELIDGAIKDVIAIPEKAAGGSYSTFIVKVIGIVP
jgi:hypothetical protein